MAQKKTKARNDVAGPGDFLIITVSELDRFVYEVLQSEGAAQPHPDDPGTYVISDQERARSQVVMPKVLARFGRQGWRLTAVNKMECYIFERTENRQPVEYKVLSTTDIDRLSMKVLQERGQLSVELDDNEEQTVHVKDASQAKIQIILPEVLGQIAEDGWKLCAINGPQLYFFVRSAKRH